MTDSFLQTLLHPACGCAYCGLPNLQLGVDRDGETEIWHLEALANSRVIHVPFVSGSGDHETNSIEVQCQLRDSMVEVGDVSGTRKYQRIKGNKQLP
jgi:hypothetical protein